MMHAFNNLSIVNVIFSQANLFNLNASSSLCFLEYCCKMYQAFSRSPTAFIFPFQYIRTQCTKAFFRGLILAQTNRSITRAFKFSCLIASSLKVSCFQRSNHFPSLSQYTVLSLLNTACCAFVSATPFANTLSPTF